MKQITNRHALTLCNRRTSHNFTDFCNFVSKVWKSCQDAVRSDSFLPYQKLALSFCPPGNLQTQRNRLGHSKSFHPPRALVNCSVVMPMSIQTGSSKYVTISRYKYASTAMAHVRCRKNYKHLPIVL